MALFQKSVLKSQLEKLDEDLIQNSWKTYKSYFLNSVNQDSIINVKEEEFQSDFLLELFDKCLGFTKGFEGQNLFQEFKNKTDSKKADGAIKIDGEVICVIELKSTKTKELAKIEDQAFGYLNSHPNCKYVVTSNFRKLRFYIQNKTEFEEFDLFNLSEERFRMLWLCLSFNSISSNLPLELKNRSLVNEEKITKQLYSDYSSFRQELFNDIVKHNPNYEQNLILNKTQKLLDRILFILFAEDRGILPVNAISEILNNWESRKEFGDDVTLYMSFITYFHNIYKGRTHKDLNKVIFSYNGGLFDPDEDLERLIISDEILLNYGKKLTAYDFESDVSVNILGHIFEHSLSEIEELQNQIEGKELDKSKSKRKKDGVFYTPQYITNYIVENTVGKLCEEKKIELNIIEDEYLKGRKGRPKNKLEFLRDILEEYRKWLLGLTICDPACGSGAFLNQALEFLISEHNYIDELQNSLLGGGFKFPEVENSILENNLYGVDINKESVEIAKLSLWLRTAQKGRKLTSLNNNIKCGNSLIDDPEVAGDKAYNWKDEFPEVFEKGGFDVIIGNPPYVQLKEFSEYYIHKYNTTSSGDLYALFYEKSIHLLVNNGLLGFITPSSFMTNIGFMSLREELLRHKIKALIDLGANVFSDASVDSAVVIIQKGFVSRNILKTGVNFDVFKDFEQEIFSNLTNKIFNIYLNTKGLQICNKLENRHLKFHNYISFSRGVEFGFRSEKVIGEKSNEMYVPLLCGGNIGKQEIVFENKYILFDIENSKIYKTKNIYEEEKILIKRIGNSIIGSYDDKGYYNVCDVYNLQLKTNDIYNLKSVSSIVNSQLINFFYDTKFKSVKKLFPKIPIQNLKLLPIPKYIKNIDSTLIKLTDEILYKRAHRQSKREQFIQYIKSDLNLTELSAKLKKWDMFDFNDFIKELNKAIKKSGGEKLTKMDEMGWMEVFETKKAEAVALKTEIEQTDKEIDQMVYELYGLTKEEIEIVENATK
ncbi:N-6 DNA methylase [Flavobacteriaceae bacterium]|nr:N-6 DNA methylase [Flavobacteriaceae bacterium]